MIIYFNDSSEAFYNNNDWKIKIKNYVLILKHKKKHKILMYPLFSIFRIEL